MVSSTNFYTQQLTDWAYYQVYGYVLGETPENLQWALKQNKDDILKYTFKDSFPGYSILEFAVKCGDVEAVKTLIDLGANVEYSQASGMGNILHFYIKCLAENTPPNLSLLNLLIDTISDINDEEAGSFCTPLEYALTEMAHFKSIHWDVIDILLQRGSRIID